MQNQVNLDEKIKQLLDIVKRKRDFSIRDKDDSVKVINKHFEMIHKKVDERKNFLYNKII